MYSARLCMKATPNIIDPIMKAVTPDAYALLPQI